jgi:hypothetical protein
VDAVRASKQVQTIPVEPVLPRTPEETERELDDRHGNYTQWVKDNFKGSPRTAQVYTRMARKAQSPADLGNSIDATDKALRSAAKPADTPRLLGTMQAWDLFRILSVKVFAANHDAMPNLMTVNLEATGDQLIAVATDRFVVGVARAEYQGDPFNVNIHTGYVDQVLRMNVSRFSRQCDVTIRITDDAELEFTTDEQKVIIPVTGYDFPPWRKLIPDTIDSDDSEPCHALSVSLLAKFAAIDSAQKCMRLFPRGGRNAAVVSIGTDDNFVGITMPTTDKTDPLWMNPNG